MSIHLVTFSDASMSRSASRCINSSEDNGIQSRLWWARASLKETAFYASNKSLLDTPRGVGLWAWKPWIILQLLEGKMSESQWPDHPLQPVSDGDIVIYADAGIEFINNVNYVIDRMDQDIFLFGNMWEHAHWCKGDIVDAITPGWEWDSFGKQAQASVIFFRVNDWTRAFVKEWLLWATLGNGRLIDDSASRQPNHPEFKENRHDQAILTTMAYRDGLRLHWWPASYNDGAFIYERGDYPDEGYPVLFNHHRRRDHEWEAVA